MRRSRRARALEQEIGRSVIDTRQGDHGDVGAARMAADLGQQLVAEPEAAHDDAREVAAQNERDGIVGDRVDLLIDTGRTRGGLGKRNRPGVNPGRRRNGGTSCGCGVKILAVARPLPSPCWVMC